MKGIYEDISYNRNRKLPKLKLFFNLSDHACDTMKYLPVSVVDEYLKMHLKEEITYEDIFELIKLDYISEISDAYGLSTNIMEYLQYYIDTKQLNSPKIIKRSTQREEGFSMDLAVKETIRNVFDTREGKIFLLAGKE